MAWPERMVRGISPSRGINHKVFTFTLAYLYFSRASSLRVFQVPVSISVCHVRTTWQNGSGMGESRPGWREWRRGVSGLRQNSLPEDDIHMEKMVRGNYERHEIRWSQECIYRPLRCVAFWFSSLLGTPDSSYLRFFTFLSHHRNSIFHRCCLDQKSSNIS
jgi:hypothetical protein